MIRTCRNSSVDFAYFLGNSRFFFACVLVFPVFVFRLCSAWNVYYNVIHILRIFFGFAKIRAVTKMV